MQASYQWNNLFNTDAFKIKPTQEKIACTIMQLKSYICTIQNVWVAFHLLCVHLQNSYVLLSLEIEEIVTWGLW